MNRSLFVYPMIVLLCLFTACAQGAPGDDLARLRAAQDELLEVRDALTRYAEDHDSEYPESSAITSHSELVRILSPYTELPDPPQASWTFVSYLRAHPDTFVLRTKAGDSRETDMVITSIVTWTDADILEAAILELELVIKGFLAYQADNEESAFPGVSEITSQADIVNIVNNYVQIPSVESAKWRWMSYARLNANWFVLRVEVKNQDKTTLYVTKDGISSERPSPPPPE